MPRLPEKKAGIIACSGEELAEGTITRLAALKVLQELRPDDTVTICLPLFLAGGKEDRAFARFHPTITVDGCEMRCAARGTEMYSGKPTASVVVSELIAQHGLDKPEGRRRLNESGSQAVEITAQRIAQTVDQVLGKENKATEETSAPAPQETKVATCSCGSGVPVTKLTINGEAVEIVALSLILQQFYELRRKPAAAAEDLLETVRVYNYVPAEAEQSYREAILREYETFCQKEATL